MMADDLCPGFEPQTYLKDRCKRCFRLKAKHGTSALGGPPSGTSGGTSAPPVKRHMTWRERVYGPEKEQESETVSATASQGGATAKEGLGLPPARSGPESSRALSTATSFESLNDVKSMVSAISDDENDDKNDNSKISRTSTPTENLDQNDSRAFIRMIKTKLEVMESKCGKLENENAELRKIGTSSNTGANLALSQMSNDVTEKMRQLEDRLQLAESMYQDYREENSVLKQELRQLQETLSRGSSQETKQLRDKLKAADALCQELMEQNETLKTEVTSLHTEIEEATDQFREEEIEEFRELQRELEQTAKNCRILQFKLRKSERSREQSDSDRMHMEEKLRQIGGGQGVSSNPLGELMDTKRSRDLEAELRIAKEVSVRLHNELETLEEKRYKIDEENFYLKEKIRELETREKIAEVSKQKLDQTRRSNSSLQRSTEAYDVSQLMRDLNDALERETDMRDQLRFAEDELTTVRRKMSDMEVENEGLLKQLAKITGGSQGGGRAGRPPMVRSYSEGQSQIQLELAEHEARALKARLQKMEREFEQTAAKATLLQKEVQKLGGRTDFSGEDLSSSVPDTYYKQKIKILEEEIEEMTHKLEESKRAEMEAQQGAENAWKFGEKRGKKMVRSRSLEESDSNNQPATGQLIPPDLKRKVALQEQELNVLRQRTTEMEQMEQKLKEENKRLQVVQKGSKSELKDKMDEMQKDIDRLLSRITDLEQQKSQLNQEVSKYRKLDSHSTDKKVAELGKENEQLAVNFRSEKSRVKALESQLADFKQAIALEGNQKLVMMASKVEVLNTQLKEFEERYNTIHRRLIGSSATGQKYEDVLKERCERLERELAEAKSQYSFSVHSTSTGSQLPSEELDSYCATVNELSSQVANIETNLAKIDEPQSTSASAFKRVTSMKPEVKAKLLGDMDKLKTDLHLLLTNLNTRRGSCDSRDSAFSGSAPPSTGESETSATLRAENAKLKETIEGKSHEVEKLKEQLQMAQTEATKFSTDLSESQKRLLLSEERWGKEVSEAKHKHDAKMKELRFRLDDLHRLSQEQTENIEQKNSELEVTGRKLAESESQVNKLQEDLNTKYRDLQDRIDVERKKAKEYETKYQKLEELYDNDRQKSNTERDKYKSEISDLKKRIDEANLATEKAKDKHAQKYKEWQTDRKNFEDKIAKMQTEISHLERRQARKAAEMTSAETKKLVDENSKMKQRHSNEMDKLKRDYNALQNELEAKVRSLDSQNEEESKLRKELNVLRARIEDQKAQLSDIRKSRDDTKEELNRWQATWAKERSELVHKLRQEGKVQQAETAAIHLKYESRIKIMEDTTKTLHAQLAQSRRERDQYREQLLAAENGLAELKHKFEGDEKSYHDRIAAMQKKAAEYDDIQQQLSALGTEYELALGQHNTEKQLLQIERDELLAKLDTTKLRRGSADSTDSGSNTSTKDRAAQALQVAGALQTQITEMKVKHDSQVSEYKRQLDTERKTARKENNEQRRSIAQLQEQIKLLEIDKRNMLSTKDTHDADRTHLQNDRDALMQRIHDMEIHQLAFKYKLDKVADVLSEGYALNTSAGPSSPTKLPPEECARYVQKALQRALEQLEAVREDMGHAREIGKVMQQFDPESSSMSSYRSNQSGSNPNAPNLSGGKNLDTASDVIGVKPANQRSNGAAKASNGSKSGAGPYNYLERSGSTSSDLTFDNWQDRIAEIRKRSPSPSPRKMTAYPEAPPTVMLQRHTSNRTAPPIERQVLAPFYNHEKNRTAASNRTAPPIERQASSLVVDASDSGRTSTESSDFGTGPKRSASKTSLVEKMVEKFKRARSRSREPTNTSSATQTENNSESSSLAGRSQIQGGPNAESFVNERMEATVQRLEVTERRETHHESTSTTTTTRGQGAESQLSTSASAGHVPTTSASPSASTRTYTATSSGARYSSGTGRYSVLSRYPPASSSRTSSIESDRPSYSSYYTGTELRRQTRTRRSFSSRLLGYKNW